MKALRCFRYLPLFFLFFASLATARIDKRLRLVPRFTRGERVRYRIETRTSSNEHTVTPIMNPEGASQYRQSTRLVLRLDALSSDPKLPTSQGAPRFRATFELANSDSDADGYAPQAAKLDDAVDGLKGQSFEFSIAPGNNLAGVQNLSEIAPDREVAARVLSWVHVLFAPVDVPAQGVEIGQKWSNERPLADLPLTGVIWRNESRYLRDESCAASSGVKSAPGSAGGTCAVLLTRFSIFRRGSEHSDATPEAYIHNGLRTSGKWTGSGQSLDAISLASGLLVSSTQTATQEMNYEIHSASSGSRIRHIGRTTTQTEITLLPPTPAKS